MILTSMWVLYAILIGALWGFKEGMIMDWTPIRDSEFFQYYHAIGFALIALFIAQRWIPIPDARVALGSIIFAWESMESAYALERFRRPFGDTENVLGLDIVICGWLVPALHCARVAVAVALVVI